MLKQIINNIRIINKTKTYRFVLILMFSIIITLTLVEYVFIIKTSDYDIYSYFPLTNSDVFVANNLMLFLAPLCSSIFVVDLPSVHKDMEVSIFTRIKKNKFYFSNLIASFITGFVLVLLLVVSMYLIALAMWNSKVTYFTEYPTINLINPGFAERAFSSLLLNHPIIYNLFYIFLLSLYSGLMSALGYSIALINHKKYLISLYMFAVSLPLIFFKVIFPNGLATWYPQNLFLPNSLQANSPGIFTISRGIVFWIAILTIVPIVLVMIKSRQEEI